MRIILSKRISQFPKPEIKQKRTCYFTFIVFLFLATIGKSQTPENVVQDIADFIQNTYQINVSSVVEYNSYEDDFIITHDLKEHSGFGKYIDFAVPKKLRKQFDFIERSTFYKKLSTYVSRFGYAPDYVNEDFSVIILTKNVNPIGLAILEIYLPTDIKQKYIELVYLDVIDLEPTIIPSKQLFDFDKYTLTEKCYDRMFIDNRYESVEFTFFEYKGGNKDLRDVHELNIVGSEADPKWVKKRADRDCLSSDPEDCLIWCLEEEEEITHSIFAIADTSKVEQFEKRTFQKKILTKVGGFTEWHQVVCESELTYEMLKEIEQALQSKGYACSYENEEDMNSIKRALLAYQKDFGLPIGDWNFTTLEHL